MADLPIDDQRRRMLGCPCMTIKARVHAGRIVVDETTNLPEGTEIEPAT
jgi:hypothetical protein